MEVRISNGGFGNQGAPAHRHLPYWSAMRIENEAPSLAESMIDLGLRAAFWWMNPPAQNPAAELRERFMQSADFLARRSGLKPGINFAVLQTSETEVRYAFASLSGGRKFYEQLKRLNHPAYTAMNDDSYDHPAATVVALPFAKLALHMARPAAARPQLPVVTLEKISGSKRRAANRPPVLKLASQ